jgi:hypothetical protein
VSPSYQGKPQLSTNIWKRLACISAVLVAALPKIPYQTPASPSTETLVEATGVAMGEDISPPMKVRR